MKEKSRICIYTRWTKGFVSTHKLLTIVKEWYIGEEVTYGKILFQI